MDVSCALMPRFDVVGYGCMTCIGNSGPLPEPVVEAITQVIMEVCVIDKNSDVQILQVLRQSLGLGCG